MDPYIEARGVWRDFHDDLTGEIKRALAPLLPERYFVQLEDRSYVVMKGADIKEEKSSQRDVGVESAQRENTSRAGTAVLAESVTSSEAVTMRAFIDEHFRETFIEVYTDDPEVRLVTCIEILSPSNKRKRSEGWEQYLRKRNSLLLGSANLVAIDLLRGGQRMPMMEPWPKSAYYILVCRQSRAPYCQVWPAHMQQPVPDIPVPLACPDPDIPLSLSPMIAAVFERSRYSRRIDYTKPLNPPLTPAEAELLKAHTPQ